MLCIRRSQGQDIHGIELRERNICTRTHNLSFEWRLVTYSLLERDVFNFPRMSDLLRMVVCNVGFVKLLLLLAIAMRFH